MNQEIAAYLAAGWALCKIKPREKGAFETGWSTREGAHVGQDAAGLRDWAGGVGLLHAYSGTCAIDVDNMKLACEAFGAHGIDLAACFRAADACVWWRGDPSRMKLLYALPEPLVSVQRGQHGFEFRCMSQSGTSMQDVLPPSIHESGQAYRWLKGDWRALPPLPAELRKIWPRLKALFPETLGAAAVKPKAGGSSLTAAAMVGAGLSAGEGERNAWLSGQLFAYLKRGGDYEAGRAWLHALNEDRCEPPEDGDKVDKIWRSKGHIEPDPLVIVAADGTPMEFEEKPELPHGYSWDGEWIMHLEGKDLKKLITQPLWVERIVRSRGLDGHESRRLEVMTRDGPHLITTEHLLTKVEVTLGNIGINVIEEDAKRVRRYLVRGKEFCESKGKIVDSYNTLGWQADNSFLVGDRLYRAGVPYTRVALSEGLQSLTHDMAPAPQGSLAAWRAAAMEIVQPNNMSQAFGFLMGMAAPLMKLSGERGGIYSLLGESGQGKSTVQNAISTVWGSPDAFRTVAQDTVNARMIKLAMLSNLPLMGEELTKMEPVELRNLAYSISEGRDKDRATQEGTLRENVGTWHTLMVSSSNRSLLEALLLADSDAAAFRLLEDTVALPKGAKQSDGDRIMRGLVANHGHAGFVFAQYLVDHREHIAKLIERTGTRLSERVLGSTKERIRVNMLACALVAGAILNASGILSFNVNAFADYGVDLLKRNMGTQDASAVTFADVLQGFIDANQPGVLRMKNNAPLNVVSLQGRSTPLVMRYDLGTEELTINRTVLHRHVQGKGQNWSGFKEWLNTQGYLKRESRVMLSAGSGLPSSPQVWCLTLDNQALGGIDFGDRSASLTTAAFAG